LKILNASFHRSDSSGGYIGVEWSPRNTEDGLQFPRTMSRRTAINGYSDSVGDIVNSDTNSIAVQANILYTAFTAQSFMWGMTLHPITDGKRLAVYEYRNMGIEERISSRGDRRVGVRLGTNGTDIQVYVIRNDVVGGGVQRLQFSKVTVNSRKIRTFTIRRNLNSPTVPEDSGSSINGVTMPDIGKTNGATFQGIAAGQAIYDGPDLTVHLGMPGIVSFPMAAGWRFRSDSYGFYDGIPERMYTQRWELTTNYTATGWTNVSTLGAPFTDIVQCSTASFAAFVS
jgi:hypothetical protein